ncbi:hypothetical protein [Lysobacter sp. Root983]|uniref:hypothetical protein n=1 Tax=Lysobacter sp. Root983 TaxID=1736613 RepID=UPI00070A1BD5|nr:hypothetical protein [Lysobacter sp. Root983]KRD73545.1 hypothetical protein ASE43_18220 [Lysobacter sp. Root983]
MSRQLRFTRMAAACLLPLLVLPLGASSTPVGPITEIVVEENRIGPKGEGCETFVMTRARARAFFNKAVVISGRQQHDFFLYGPCSARGTFKTRYDTWQWEIRSLGTGSIAATNGDVFLLGDPRQESSVAEY